MSLLGVKRTCPFALHMSANDPKRTLDDRLRAVILGQYNLLSRAPRATMRRREFIMFVGFSAVARPIGALAQKTSKIWRVGMLETTSETLNAPNVNAFRRGLRELGYVEGQNLVIEYRSGEGRIERFPDLAVELVRLKVDVLVTRGTPASLAAKNATTTIPIVMAAIGEPVGT